MDINLEDVFEIFEEPEHSKNVLLNFQEKYNIDSEELYLFYQQGGINCEESPISEEDFKSLIHHFIIFKENGGDPWELKKSDIWEENIAYQNTEKDYSPCSFFSCVILCIIH
ncbi:hypothetical protein C7954_15011 [Halanaerobium congolense]|jgi:hypothetical protein|uniref:Uncharacterized protein n=1 Tax=Halanaerobium congolense TaxID=54121 RepID=A0A318E080_9FIRM|nr:hypothetical protein [Halanaerobium congolense]PXV62133.1 hypothetical protein C8C78_1384 [Halanaerobium congolense]TDX36430.1 hypothetical protein C7954_15011 [Halanaerobium congolense]